jgi:hypothetical protein
VRIDRLELETTSETVELVLHPLLTVVTGLGRLEREALTSEILSAIGQGRPGLSADVVGPDGKSLRVLRPLVGNPCVVDAISEEDLTDTYRRGEAIDLLASTGLDRGQARSMLRIGRRDVKAPVEKWEVIEQLARLDQDELWRTAKTVLESEVELTETARVRSEKQRPIDGLDDLHAAVDLATDRLEQSQPVVVAVVASCLSLGVVGGALFSPLTAALFAIIGTAAVGVQWSRQRAAEMATEREISLLNENRLWTYLDYQMTQVEQLTEGPERGHQLDLQDQRRSATARWDQLTGAVSLPWAVDHRPEITQLSLTIDAPEPTNPHLLDVLPRLDDARLGAVDAIEQRVGQLSVLFPEGMMLILDDPLCDLDDFELTAALAAVDEAMSVHQLVLMSDDPRIVGWARQLVNTARATVIHLGGHTDPVELAPRAPMPAPQLVNA